MQLKRNKEMEFETLKKNYKKQIIIGALAICVIGGALTFNLTRAKYKITESIPLVKGNINYQVPDMRVVAINVSEDGTNYNVADEIPVGEYTLNADKTICKVATETSGIENAPKDNNITFEYVDNKINIRGVSKRNTRCYLYFDKINKISIPNIIANLNAKTETPNFANAATTDEGIYAVEDGMYGGTSYYWRGAATTNYVKFAEFCWRIIRINGDGSVRLIYDGTICHQNGESTVDSIAKTGIQYNPNKDQSNYVGWTYEGTLQRPIDNTTATPSNVKTELELWYSANISGINAEKVADGKFCNDRDAQIGYVWSIKGDTFLYASRERSIKNYTPTLSCPTRDVYTLKVGIITADEAHYAGGKSAYEDNDKYYLYCGYSYWTMSPSLWNGSAYMYAVYYNGMLECPLTNNNTGLRPVINLRSDITFSGGDGTLDNPYVVQ